MQGYNNRQKCEYVNITVQRLPAGQCLYCDRADAHVSAQGTIIAFVIFVAFVNGGVVKYGTHRIRGGTASSAEARVADSHPTLGRVITKQGLPTLVAFECTTRGLFFWRLSARKAKVESHTG